MGLAKARITVEHTGASFDVLFNPEEYSLNKDNNFASQGIPGLSGPLLQFVHGNVRTLEMELFFDTNEPAPPRDVREETQKVVGLLDIDSDLHAPPVLRVSWASLQFRCVLVKAAQKFIRFLDDGRPVRAKINVIFNEFIDPDTEAKEVNRQTADFSKVHIVKRGETLSLIAALMYGSPQVWRPIAVANGIDDPRSIAAGQALRIPALPFVDPATAEVVS
ncbi:MULTISPECIES: LysM peptidoglycan-binding domain-containing protein [unclassified Burkholderia]|uniref:CIS tube protein n=1 Tax=unclassified Burkholderia TaxID=2613784 RepID=UPI00141F1001|nr:MULTISPECIES: LysM peptidoglycan-binding domain-containing protein [unclassified Burkholderia]NIE58648.1 LysM peptidoglycan-binding domain-containing protein [Burkholderia sp. Ap-955]NIF10151.1 LysM peptidoglycan-binding domain-containing protein [Burkholderia sp. Ax-1735]NIG03602.1 LysM peptidoglycan-binding domain-containing protein [Burkholderia sp. Tr-849]